MQSLLEVSDVQAVRVTREQRRDVKKQLEKVKFRFLVSEDLVDGKVEGTLEIINNNEFSVMVDVFQIHEERGYVNMNGYIPKYHVPAKSRMSQRYDVPAGVVKVAVPAPIYFNQGFGTYALQLSITAFHFQTERIVRIENRVPRRR